jgi:hypothetical protein
LIAGNLAFRIIKLLRQGCTKYDNQNSSHEVHLNKQALIIDWDYLDKNWLHLAVANEIE